MSKIIVVGANHAGTACINTILSNYGKCHEVVVFDQNSNISFLGCGMALWIGKQIDSPEGLFYSSKEELESSGAKVYMNARVESIDYDKKLVHAIVDGEIHMESYDKLILATGSQPVIPHDISGVQVVEGTCEFEATLENLQFVKLYQNAEQIIKKLNNKSIQSVAVVGAGYIGVELAEAFERRGKEVILVEVADTCLRDYYDRAFTNLMSKNLEEHGIKLAFGQTVQAIEGDNRVECLVTDKEKFNVDMVILSVGCRPNNLLGGGRLKLFRNGAFLVDKNQRTSMPDVYAIGDCATVYDNAMNDMSYIALASNAVRSGIVGAHNACGIHLESIGVQGSNGICVYGLKMVATGLTLEKARYLGYNADETVFTDLQKPEFIKHDNHEVTVRIIYDIDSRLILGAQIASREDISMSIHLFSLAIQEKLTIDRLALLDFFFLPHFNKPYNYITMAALKAE